MNGQTGEPIGQLLLPGRWPVQTTLLLSRMRTFTLANTLRTTASPFITRLLTDATNATLGSKTYYELLKTAAI